MSNPILSWRRVRALCVKETRQIVRDPSSWLIAVVIPLLSGPRMLMSRNLLYTAVTRARQCVCVVGLQEMFDAMVDNQVEQRRYSSLDRRIRELQAFV